MPALGAPRSHEDRYNVTVEIDGIAVAAFTTVSELSMEVEVIEYREGGQLAPSKSPGLVNFPNITLSRGVVFNDSDLYNWMRQVVDVDANKGLIDNEYKRTLDIVVRDRDKSVLKRWRVKNAWPRKYVAGEWDSNANEKTMESVELAHEGFRRIGP